jgi:nucleoside-diphosphate-sugar epimerase
MSKKICVLGSEGQIGKPLCETLRSLGYSVSGIDVKLGNHDDLTEIDSCKEYYKNTINTITGADFVFFLAFDIGGANYLSTEDCQFDFISYNTKLMNNTFEMLQRGKNPFIFASSMMAARSEQSNYGFLKKLGERYTKSLGGLSVRFWNVFGHQRWDGKSNVVTELVNQVLDSSFKEVRLVSTGDESRDFMHVDDCVVALIAMMNNYEKLLSDNPESIHLATGKMTTVKELANMVCNIHKEVTGEHKDVVCGGESTFTHNTKDYLPNSKHLLGSSIWTPQISLNNGLKKVYLETLAKKKTK